MAESTTLPVPPPASGSEKPKSDYQRPEELLQKFHLSLTNAKTPEIQNELLEYNYDVVRLDEGLAKHANVVKFSSNQKKEKGEQLQASKVLENLLTTGRDKFVTSRSIAKTAFEDDPNAFVALGLLGKTNVSVSGLTNQASTFYSNILGNPGFLSKMAYFGYTEEKLAREKGQIDALFDANARHKKELGEAVEATKIRDEAFDDLDAWMSKFYKVAKAALKSKPEVLKQLGI